MKILHVLSTPRAEGTPNLVLDWLATGEHEQEVFVLNSQPADLTDRLKAGAAWYGEADFFSRGWRKFTGIATRLRRICRERQPDLVLCWPTGFANWVCLGARLARVRHLLVHCGNPPNRGFKADWMTRYGMWPLAVLGAQCVCCSDYVRDRFRSVPLVSDQLFHTVYNCARVQDVAVRAEKTRSARTPNGRRCGVMVATLERHKDHRTLLEAIPLILSAEPNFLMRLAGDGSLRRELEDKVRELGIAHAVEFLGMRRDIPELLGSADLFVLSTTAQEGLGSVLLEAMAAGLPVVASDVPACRELLHGGRYGTLVTPADPVALARAILAALRMETRTDAQAQTYAYGFMPQRMMREYLQLLHQKSSSPFRSAAA